MIKYPECRREISDKASSCPHCGNPIKPVTIEQTSKNWKVAKLVSWMGFLVGLFIYWVHFRIGGTDDPQTKIGIMIAAAGFVGIWVSKIGAWWSNE